MRKFCIKNFDKFQHYKDRRPPWIKLYADVLEDYEFSRLQDASKLHLVLIWVLASRHENAIPWDTDWLARRIGATDTIDLDILLHAGFIEEIQDCNKSAYDASNMLAAGKQDATPETETETETKDSPPLSPKKKMSFKQAMERSGLNLVCFDKTRRLFAEKGWPPIDLELLWEEFEAFWRDERPREKKADWPRAFYNRAVERRTWRAYQIEGTHGNGISPETQPLGSEERVAGALEILRQRGQ